MATSKKDSVPKAAGSKDVGADEVKYKIFELVRKRASYKSKITLAFRKTETDFDSSQCKSLIDMISSYLGKIEIYDEQICELYALREEGEDLSESHLDELTKQSDYLFLTKAQLNSLLPVERSDDKNKHVVSNCELKLPNLICSSFSGEGTHNLEYSTFISQFNNIVGLRTNLSDSTKFTYLKTYLKGYALKVVQHLLVNDTNYTIALNLLESEFLNKDSIIDDLFKKILSIKPKYDLSFLETKLYINEIRCILSDLKQHGTNLLGDEPSMKFVSHVVFNQLPLPFKQELVRKVDNNYPTVIQLFDNYVEIVRTLNLRQNNKFSSFDVPNVKSDSSKFKPNVSYNFDIVKGPDSRSRPTNLLKVNDKPDFSRLCKLCSSVGHSMLNCKKYNSHDSRMSRCSELKVCSLCSSTKHLKDNCPQKLDFECTICHSKSHISAFCPKYRPSKITTNYCVNATNENSGTYILPTITIQISKGKTVTDVRCLLDTGSQRSYISSSVAERLSVGNCAYDKKILVNTFAGGRLRELSEMGMSLRFAADSNACTIPVLIDKQFSLNFEVDSLPDAISNIKRNFKLADSSFDSAVVEGRVELEGILGIDALQLIGNFSITQCCGGSAFLFYNCVLPFGNVDNFLSASQLDRKYSIQKLDNSRDDIDDSVSEEVHVQIVNAVLQPERNYFDPINDVVSDSSVEGNLDYLFNMESIGITDDDVSDFDRNQIEKFRDGIELVDGKYFVALPWYPDKVSRVRSNFNVTKSVLTKVITDLRKRDLFNEYNDVFQQQLEEGIIEEIDLNKINVYNHIWIPHRPVIKHEQHVTTKIRPVLNCSLKIGNFPSLNEASYPGVDLLSDLLTLLFKIRTNAILAVSDVRKAFLQIRLSEDVDKNRFSILWQTQDGNLIAYRYRTLVFGLAASPFVLNYVLKFHIAKFQNDLTNLILNDNFYVDNLFMTSNSPSEMLDVYQTSCERLAEGGFELRSWFSNDESLQQQFAQDNKGTSHNAETEKVLGYSYNPSTDELSIAGPERVDVATVTKRTILSRVSKTFDPLGLATPVIVRGKILLRKLWQDKLDWDDPIPVTMSNEWDNINSDLSDLSNIKFPRRVLDTEARTPNKLVIFSDSSKKAYGFCVYGVNVDEGSSTSNLLFSKVKVAPIKTKSLPTLELLALFLALKCLGVILRVQSLSVSEVILCSDSQVALSWVMSRNVKSKNVFASNRVKDIDNFLSQIEAEFDIKTKFKYVPTDLNPADLLTRGLSLKDYSSKLNFWLRGPEFLNLTNIDWPTSNGGCFSENTKTLTNVCINDTPVPLLPLDKYSDLNKLLRVTSLVFKFIKKIRKLPFDAVLCRDEARIYLIKCAQRIHFCSEIEFLTSSRDKTNVPPLVLNLNLFLDENFVLRSKGRLDKCNSCNYDLVNPIMLPKDNFLTELFIKEFHFKCKHLGVSSTLNSLRNHGYWLPKGRAVIKRVLSDCVTCKRINSFSFKYPKRTDYVSDRVNFITPFMHTGVDYTGHFFVKINNAITKFYLLIFTCLNIRAIHLELVPSMSTADFLLAFIKFCNFHGTPKSLYSDNGSTFINAGKILNQCVVDDPLQEHLVRNSIRHIKIPVYSAWVGSAWERLIRVVKSSIYKTIGRKQLEYFQFVSLLSDIQNTVNNRPLTYRDSDVQNLEVITPNSFLKLGTDVELSFGNLDGSQLELPTRKVLVNTVNKRDETFLKFKQLWFDSYLLSLRESSRDTYESNWHDRVRVGDVVLLYSPFKSRVHWPIGRVVEKLTGNDNKTRCVRVRRSDSSEEVYSVSHLYPLELSLLTESDGATDKAAAPIIRELPQRKAAIKCKKKLKIIN